MRAVRRFRAVLTGVVVVLGLSVTAATAGVTSHTRLDLNGNYPPPSGPSVVPTAISGTNDGVLHFITDYNIEMWCYDSAITGDANWGEAVTAGQTIGQIDELAFTDCWLFSDKPIGLQLVVEKNAGTWPIKVRNTPAAAGDPVDITIEGISAYVHSTGSTPLTCELGVTGDVDAIFYPGSASTHDGQIGIDSNGAFPLGPVDAYDGSGTKTLLPPTAGTCGGQIYTGDRLDMAGDFWLDVNPASPGSNVLSRH